MENKENKVGRFKGQEPVLLLLFVNFMALKNGFYSFEQLCFQFLHDIPT
jgi:hypothetical protein